MNIKNKLYISAGISVVLVVVLLSVVSVASARIAEENEKHQLLMDVYESVSELDIVTYDYLLHREERMEHQWNIKHDSLGEILEKEEEGLKSIRADYATIGNLFSQITANYEERQQYIREGASQEKIDAITGLEERLVAQLLITSHLIITDASRLAGEAHIEATEAQRVASNLTVILMDIKMPKVNGYTSCSRIKADIRTKNTPVIMITAVACSLNDRKIMRAIGAEGYVTKPLNLKELRAIVEGFLAHGTRSDEIL